MMFRERKQATFAMILLIKLIRGIFWKKIIFIIISRRVIVLPIVAFHDTQRKMENAYTIDTRTHISCTHTQCQKYIKQNVLN